MIYQPDSFDFYGTGATGRNNMLVGDRWAEIGSGYSPSAAKPHTGTYSMISNQVQSVGMRKLWPSAITTLAGVMFNQYFDALPDASNQVILWSVRDAANANQVNFILQPNGSIVAKRGTAAGGTQIAASAANVIQAGTYPRIQLACKVHGSTGIVKAEVNGVSAFSSTGLNTAATANIEQSMFYVFNTGNAGVTPSYLDNLIPWYDDGGDNSDMLEEKVVETVYFDSDGSDTAWVRNTGSIDAAAIDDAGTTGPDGDTTYLEAAAVSDASSFTIPSPSVDDIVAFSVAYFSKKVGTDTCKVQAALKGTLATDGTENAIDTAYGYKTDTWQRDPDASGTPGIGNAALGAMVWKITRTV